MTKMQELDVLDQVIERLGNRSYLGAWFASVRAEVARDVANDVIPSRLPSAAAVDAAAIVVEAQDKAAAIVAEAERKALFRVGMARDEVARIKGEASKALKVSLLNLGGDW